MLRHEFAGTDPTRPYRGSWRAACLARTDDGRSFARRRLHDSRSKFQREREREHAREPARERACQRTRESPSKSRGRLWSRTARSVWRPATAPMHEAIVFAVILMPMPVPGQVLQASRCTACCAHSSRGERAVSRLRWGHRLLPLARGPDLAACCGGVLSPEGVLRPGPPPSQCAAEVYTEVSTAVITCHNSLVP